MWFAGGMAAEHPNCEDSDSTELVDPSELLEALDKAAGAWADLEVDGATYVDEIRRGLRDPWDRSASSGRP
jgi:hypothetical protein